MFPELIDTDPRVIAVRADKLVGRGSCSHVDECMTDAELAERLDAEEVRTAREAVRVARRWHRLVSDVWADIAGTAF